MGRFEWDRGSTWQDAGQPRRIRRGDWADADAFVITRRYDGWGALVPSIVTVPRVASVTAQYQALALLGEGAAKLCSGCPDWCRQL